MEQISLDGEWELLLPSTPINDDEGLDELIARTEERLPASVPGNVELDLMRAGRLADPFVGDNIYRLRELEGRDWIYRTTFKTPEHVTGRRVLLRFHGIDCFATIWLNHEKLGTTDNMLIEHSFDVTRQLRGSDINELVVCLRSAVREAGRHRYEPSQHAPSTNFEQLYVRKAPHMYGWDIAPRAVSAGIWRSVTLELHEKIEIADLVYVTRSIDGSDVRLEVFWQIEVDQAEMDDLRLHFVGTCGESTFFHEEKLLFSAGVCRIDVQGAKLWWPAGYGSPHLYEVDCSLLQGEKVLDLRNVKVGFRTVKLERTEVTTADGEGQFLFRVNGEPIMCKGTNWVPLDAFHSRDAERYERVLDLAGDLHCNIVRCWGGNVYEDAAFFDSCDRRGIMIWQDFSYACARYPQNDEFLQQVRAEAEQVVRKLRNHASLILWSGDNEIDAAYMDRGLSPEQNRISREVVPQVCASCDPYRPYLPSSPYVSRQAAKAGSRYQDLLPEQHLWGPRDYYKSPFYARNTAHFASEIGYHGCPNASSVARFIEPAHLWPWQENRQWRAHASDPVPDGGPFAYRIKLMADQIREMFGFAPASLDEFALASQISQAEAKKYFIEHFRIRKWRKTGIIWWNLIDCWPQFSDAVVDYYFVKKLAYYYIRRVQQPVCIMVDEPQAWQCPVVISNDTRRRHQGTYAVSDADTGAVLLSGAFTSEANRNQELGRIPVSHGDHRLLLIRWETGGRRFGNHYLHGTPPFSFQQYREFLRRIAELPDSFDADEVAK